MRCKDGRDDQGHSRAVSSCATPGLLDEDAGGVRRNKVDTMGCRGLLQGLKKEGSCRAPRSCQRKQRLERAKKKDMVTVIDDPFGNGVGRSLG
jgi:hypothetical protein